MQHYEIYVSIKRLLCAGAQAMPAAQVFTGAGISIPILQVSHPMLREVRTHSWWVLKVEPQSG